MTPSPVIHWFRRDLRLSDNSALYQASLSGQPVIPVYIVSTWKKQHLWTGPKRQAFLCSSLDSLARNLETLDARLIVRHGPATQALTTLVRETGATAIYFNHDPDPFGKATEQELRKQATALGITCHGFDDVALHRPDEVLTKDGNPYRVYTPYSRTWLSLPKPSPLPKPNLLHTPTHIPSLPLPTLAHWGLTPEADTHLVEAGERAARERLKTAIEQRISSYDRRRDLPAEPGTSRLSQDLRFGLVSIRTIYHRALQARAHLPHHQHQGVDTFIKELAWREFYFAILHHFPHVLEREFNTDWHGLPWDEPGPHFDRWKSGQTGFPIVDAGIRELLTTGHMHNRVRMIVAMFLTKDLHLDWRLGEQFFLQHLVDGEIASNNGGWQWSAGTGADAAPYFRIQNPWTQTQRYDPTGAYIRRWVPELAHTPAAKFFEPPKNGLPIAPGYPFPCVDHNRERLRTLEIFKRHREATQGHA